MSKTNTFILQGKKSFSDSKLEQLCLGFNKLNNLNSEISSNEIYILASKNNQVDLDGLKNILYREKRLSLYEESIKFIPARVELDLSGFTDDIWSH